MKKNIIKVIVFLITATFLIAMFAWSWTTIYYSNKHQIITENSSYSLINQEYHVYTSIKGLDEEFVQSIIQTLQKNSVAVQNALKRHWIIAFCESPDDETMSDAEKYVTEDVRSQMDENSVCGYTDIIGKIIYIYRNHRSDITELMIDLTHEIGHVVAFEFGGLESSKEFKECYKKYNTTFEPIKDNVTKGYAVSNLSEFFAVSYTEYVLNKNQVEIFYPRINDYFQTITQKENKTYLDDVLAALNTIVN